MSLARALPQVSLLAPLLAATLTGCHDPPRGANAGLADRESAARVWRLGQGLNWIAESEASRPQRLDRMGGHVNAYFADQVGDAHRHAEWRRQLIDADMNRPTQRLPHATQAALRMLMGRAANIEPNAILLFY
ncbi:MAG: hypothetical protein IPM13_02675 [Phycisphaerales bacterium]|nr:hypothetical protein [Phycisphaerales bacterium]